MKKFFKTLLICFAIILILLGGTLLALKGYSSYQTRFYLTPELRESARKNKTEKIYFKVIPKKENAPEVPEAVQTPESPKIKTDGDSKETAGKRIIEVDKDPLKFVPYSDETNRLAEEFYSHKDETSLTEALSRYTQINDEMTTDTESVFQRMMASYKKIGYLVDTYINTINRPDYDIELWGNDPDMKELSYFQSSYYPDIYNGNKMLEIKAYSLVKEKKYMEALETAETMMRAIKVNDYSSFSDRRIMENIYSRACTAYNWAIQDCESTDTLEYAFNHLKELKGFSEFYNFKISPAMTDMLEPIRAANRFGMNINVEGLTYQELWGKSFQVRADQLEKRAAETPNKSGSVSNSELTLIRYFSVIMGGDTRNPMQTAVKGLSPFVRDYFYNRYILPRDIDLSDRKGHSVLAKEYYNLLLVNAALKLYKVRTGAYPDTLANLIPDYFAEIPKDYYPGYSPGKILEWKYSGGKVYSCGEDRNDDGGKICFDPSSYDHQKGDIYFKEMKK